MQVSAADFDTEQWPPNSSSLHVRAFFVNIQVSELIAEATFSAPQRAAIKQSFEELKKVILNTDAVPADEVSWRLTWPVLVSSSWVKNAQWFN